MFIKTIIILAKSAKNNNYCIAGINVDTNEWVRPVSSDQSISEAVPLDDVVCSDNIQLQVLDVVKIQFNDNLNNNPIQPENLYYDEHYRWRKINEVNIQYVTGFHGFDNRNAIFYNYDRSIPEAEIKGMPQLYRESLLLLPIENLIIDVEHRNGNPKFYANFEYNGRQYKKFGVSDIDIINNFMDHKEGQYFLKKNANVVFSLTNPFHYNSKCYKMIAQVV